MSSFEDMSLLMTPRPKPSLFVRLSWSGGCVVRTQCACAVELEPKIGVKTVEFRVVKEAFIKNVAILDKTTAVFPQPSYTLLSKQQQSLEKAVADERAYEVYIFTHTWTPRCTFSIN